MSEIIPLLKFITCTANVMEEGRVPPYVRNNILTWRENSIQVLKSARVANFMKPITAITNIIRHSESLTSPQLDTMIENSKALRDAIFPRKAVLTEGINSTHEISQLVVPCLTYLRSQTESSYRGITNKINIVGDPAISKLFVNNAAPHHDTNAVQAYMAFIHHHTRKNKDYMDKADRDKLTDEERKQLNALASPVSKMVRAAITKAVRSSGKPYLPLGDIRRNLTVLGLPTYILPTGVDSYLMIDDVGKYYTVAGRRLAAAPIGGAMQYNPKYDPKKDNGFVIAGIPLVGDQPQYYVTEDWIRGKRAAKKDTKRGILENNIDDLSDKWRSHMYGNNPDLRVLGTAVEGLYQIQPRIGNKNQETDGKRTFGYSTWQARHISNVRNDGSITVRYAAKSNVDMEHKIKPYDEHSAEFINFLVGQKQSRNPDDRIWEFDNGKPVTDNVIRGYIKKYIDPGLSPHAFRHYRGTKVFNEYVAKHPFKLRATLKETEEYWKKAAMEAGKILGHIKIKDGKQEVTGETASQSYIDPRTQAALFTDRNLRVPVKLEKLLSKPATSGEDDAAE